MEMFSGVLNKLEGADHHAALSDREILLQTVDETGSSCLSFPRTDPFELSTHEKFDQNYAQTRSGLRFMISVMKLYSGLSI